MAYFSAPAFDYDWSSQVWNFPLWCYATDQKVSGFGAFWMSDFQVSIYKGNMMIVCIDALKITMNLMD